MLTQMYFRKFLSFSCLHLIWWGKLWVWVQNQVRKKNESHCKTFLFCFISFPVKTLATACLGLFCILSLLCADIWKSYISLRVVIPGWRLFSAFESIKVQNDPFFILVLKLKLKKNSLRLLQAEVVVKTSFVDLHAFLLCLQWFSCEHSSCFCCRSTYSVLCQNEETCKWCICFIKCSLLIIKGIPYRFY